MRNPQASSGRSQIFSVISKFVKPSSLRLSASEDHNHRESEDGYALLPLFHPRYILNQNKQDQKYVPLMEALFQSLGLPMRVEWIDTPPQFRKAYQYFTEADMSHTRAAGYGGDFLPLEEGVAAYVEWLKAAEAAPAPAPMRLN